MLHRFFLAYILSALFILGGCSGSKSVDNISPIVDPFAANGNSAISFSPLATNFGVQRVLNASLPKTIILTNNASEAVYLSSIGNETSPHFSIVSSTCPLSPAPLNAYQTCYVSIIFNPQATGNLQWSLSVFFDRTPGGSQYQSIASVKGLGATVVIFSGIKTIDQIRAASVRLNWTDVVGENGFFIFKVNTGTGALEFISSAPPLSTNFMVTGLTPATNYTFRVQAIDLFGNTDSNTVNVATTTAPLPVLTAQPNMLMTTAAGEMVVGTTYNFDFNNVALGTPGVDTNMTYSCYYDTLIDGVVSPSLLCNTLPGFVLDPAFSTNGKFSWTPPVDALSEKAYEILVRGNDGSINADRIFGVNIRDPYVRSNLVLELSAPFTRGGNPGLNSPATTIWDNLLVGGSSLNATLTGAFGSGWQGNGTDITNPYRLVFDGISGPTASRATLGSAFGLGATFGFSTWINPSNLALGSNAYVLSGGGVTISGWSLRQTSTGVLSLDLGSSPGYEATVLSQSPTAFYRFEEAAGIAITDSSGNGNNGVLQSGAGLAYSVPGHDGNSFTFSGNNVINVGPFNLNVVPDYSLSVWVKTPLPANGQWKTISRGAGNDHHLIFNSVTNEFGTYLNAQGGFFGSGQLANSLSAGWHLFSVTSNAIGMNFYVDGAPTPSSFLAKHAVNDISYIGNYQGGGQPAGNLDGVAFFSRFLTASEIAAQYAGSATCQTNLTQGYWQNISGIFDGTTVTLYNNGTQACAINPVAATPGTAQIPVIGAKSDGSAAWPGQLADLKIYSSLTSASVTTTFNASKKRYLPTPLSIPNLQTWVDATDPAASGVEPADGTTISIWKDKSGKGQDLPTAGTAAVLALTGFGGLPAIHYGGFGGHQSPYVIGSDYTISYISKLNGTQNGRVVGDWSGGNILLGYWNGNMHGFYINGAPENLFGSTAPVSIAATTQKNWYTFTRSSLSGAFTFYNQGNVYATNPASSAPNMKLMLGCGYGNTGECSNVFISELVVYNRVLTPQELNVLNVYMKSKWGF